MFHRRKSQQGSMIIIAVFVIVVMGLLAANLSRIQWSNQDTLSREVLGSQAWFVAQSGNEWALSTLFPINGAQTSGALATNCAEVNSDSSSAATTILNGLPCSSLVIQCTKPEDALPNELKYYRVTSSAICSSGTIYQVQREQEVWVRALGE